MNWSMGAAALAGAGILITGVLAILVLRLTARLAEMERRLAEETGRDEERFRRQEEALRAVGKEIREENDRVRRQVEEALERSGRQMGDRFKELVTTNREQLEAVEKRVEAVRLRVEESLEKSSRRLGEQVKELIERNDRRLAEISGKVEESLQKGFENTTKVFLDVQKRLAIIDKAQEKIAELSGNVVSLQEILADKRSRGAFGEVQLSALVANLLPENSYSLQHTFENGVRADCVLFLPEPTGTVCIDAKFPLESYRKMTDPDAAESDRRAAEQQFRQDIRKHIRDIAAKYIIPGVTSDGAVMFIPAEAVFAEIHAHYPDLVEEAQRARVWLASPTTMMAILTTARAVLKDAATRKQVHIIREHLVMLSKDFGRFRTRMDNLAKHIGLVQKDVEAVHISARKIAGRFEKIERVELEGSGEEALAPPKEDDLNG